MNWVYWARSRSGKNNTSIVSCPAVVHDFPILEHKITPLKRQYLKDNRYMQPKRETQEQNNRHTAKEWKCT